jgi:translocation and assembly module TamB
LIRRGWFFAGGAAVVVALGAGFALGPGAAGIVDAQADGLRIWRLGVLRVDGVHGPWVGDLRAARISLSDSDGEWTYAEDVRLNWAPTALFGGTVRVRSLDAQSLSIARRPILSEDKPQRRSRQSMQVDSFQARQVNLAEGVAGPAGQARLAGGLTTRSGRLDALQLDLVRLDADTDQARITIAPEYGVLGADIDVTGKPGGLIAGGLGLADGVTARGRMAGTAAAGQGRLSAESGGRTLVLGELFWAEARWRFTGRLDLPETPPFRTVARLGGPVMVEASGALANDDRAFVAHVSSPALLARVTGALGKDLRPRGPMQIKASSAAPNTLAPEAPLEAAGATAEGTLTLTEAGWRFDGEAGLQGVRSGGIRAALEGPLELVDDRAGVLFAGDFAVAAEGQFVDGVALSPTALTAEGRFDRSDMALEVRRARLSGPGFAVDARGRGDVFSGQFEVDSLAAAQAGLRGQARGDWTLQRDRRQGVLRLSAEGRGGDVVVEGPMGELLGRTPQGSLEAVVLEDGLDISTARLNGDKFRGAVRGRASARGLALEVEASVRGPLTVGGALLDGSADITGRVFGAPDQPRALLEARLPQFDVAGVTLSEATARLALADGEYASSLEALYDGVVLRAVGDVRASADALSVEGLEASLGDVRTTGALRVSRGRLDGTLRGGGRLEGIAGLSGAVNVEASLSGTPELPVIVAQADLSGARLGEIVLTRASGRLNGPLSRAELSVTGEGRVGGQPAQFTGAGGLQVTPQGFTGTLAGGGRLAGLDFQTQGPITITQTGGSRAIIGGLRFADGEAAVVWRDAAAGVQATLSVRNAPVGPLAAVFGERAEGSMTGTASLASARGRLSGSAEIALSGLRVRGRMSNPLDARAQLTLADEVITGQLTAQSAQGLEATISLEAPVRTSTIPVRIAQADGAAGRLGWRIKGPADALWAVTGLLDQNLDGLVAGEGEARFGPGTVQGSGTLRLSDGAFEDRLTGVRLSQVAGTMTFTDDELRIADLSAVDADGGRLTGEGIVRGTRDGRVSLRLDGLRFLDRDAMRASADGDLALTWDETGSVLSGALRVRNASVDQPPATSSDIPVIDVLELNAPAVLESPRGHRGATTSGSRLDLAITAPGRVFTRYRGANAEWSLDLRVRGTTQAPTVFGEAQLLRGGVQVAQRPFVLTRGRIGFRGLVDDSSLDIVAERVGADLTARLTLGGTLGKPTWQLTSDPALPEDEILPQALFGTAQAELSALQAAQLAASLSALAGGSAFDLADLTRRAVGLDTFDLRQDATGISVVGGRYLTQDVFLELSRSALGETSTRVEWRVRPQLTMVTSFGARGEQRASIRWRRDY